jgi:hypothetical protein
VTPPNNEASVSEDLIRTLQQERAILLDQVARIAARSASAHPANPDAATPAADQKTGGNASASQVPLPRSQARMAVATAPQPDDVKRQLKAKPEFSRIDVSLPAGAPAIQPPIAIVPDNIRRAATDDDRISALDVVSRPFEKTAAWLKALKSKIADQFSTGPTNDTPKFPGHGIY